MDKVSYSSPAKINLFLEIKGKRDDGYHEILTWMHTISLYDNITISKSALDYSTLRSRDTGIPFGKRNLCIKAFDTVRDNSRMRKSDTVEISLDKQIPLGSGLGGGSSNAASVIVGLDELFELELGRAEKVRIASLVGSDVPFFVVGGSSVVSGRGEVLSPLPHLPHPLHLVIVKPEFSVSTGEAYKWVKMHKGSKTIDNEKLAAKISEGDIDFIFSSMFNVFEPIVTKKFPALKNISGRMKDAGCLTTQMTGSGSGVFGICADAEAASQAADALSQEADIAFVYACRTL